MAGLHAYLLAQACSPQLGLAAASDSAGVEGVQWLAAPLQTVPPLAYHAAAASHETPPTTVNSLKHCMSRDMALS